MRGNDKLITAYAENGGAHFAGVLTMNTNVDQKLGIAQSDGDADDVVEVKCLGSLDYNQSDLIPNTEYYVDSIGNVTDTNTGYKIGKAVSSTELLITN